MKKKLICLLLALCIIGGIRPASLAAEVPTESQAYSKIIAMKSKYPEGTWWSWGNYYSWNGGKGGASACMGFAYLLSDAAFGDLPARTIYPTSGDPITISKLRVGDIIRLPGHSAVVLTKTSDHITIAEGNYECRVHWGRKISAAQVKRATYYTTRYPEGYVEPTVSEPKKVSVNVGGVTYQIVDIADHWAQEHIKACLTSGLLSVTGDATYSYFKPNENATRAQVVTALYRAKGSPAPKAENSFTDVTEDWYRDAVSWASESGIVSGVTATSFSPEAHVTREQLAAIMFRFAGSVPAEADLSAYADAANVSSYAKEGIAWAVKNNIISGKNGLLIPQGYTTRAEFATMIVRFSMALTRA